MCQILNDIYWNSTTETSLMGSHHFWLNEIKQKIIATDTHNYTILNSYNSVLGMASKSILKLILFSKESLPGIYRPLGLDNLVLWPTGFGQWIPVLYGHTVPLSKFWMLRFWWSTAKFEGQSNKALCYPLDCKHYISKPHLNFYLKFFLNVHSDSQRT